MPIMYVKVKNHYLRPGNIPDRFNLQGGHRLLNPGSVVMMDKDYAEEFVKRKMGTFHPGPEFEAPPPDDPEVVKAPEKADLGNRIANAEKAVARPQQTQARPI